MKQGQFLVAGLLLVVPALADFSYQQTSQITGGSMLRMMRMVPGGGKALQPHTSRMLLKGNKLADISDEAISIIDLDAGTMTSVNMKERTYSVITFEEMRQAMAKAAQRMGEAQPQAGQTDAQMNFRVNVKETGQSREFSGLNTNEYLLTLATDITDAKTQQTATMTMETDMWMAPAIPGYDEVKRFYERMATQMAYTPEMMSFNPMMMRPGMSEGFARMAKEMAKMKGVSVHEVVNMKGIGGPGAQGGPGAPQMPPVGDAARQEAQNEANAQASRAVGGRLGGAIGGLGGLRRRQKAEQPPPQQTQQAPAQQQEASFMEMTIDKSGFSSAPVDASQMAVPAGFKQVEHPMKKMLNQ
jgi:hypothetical protein